MIVRSNEHVNLGAGNSGWGVRGFRAVGGLSSSRCWLHQCVQLVTIQIFTLRFVHFFSPNACFLALQPDNLICRSREGHESAFKNKHPSWFTETHLKHLGILHSYRIIFQNFTIWLCHPCLKSSKCSFLSPISIE